jgi:hypothetical protein
MVIYWYCANKYLLPTIRMRDALKRSGIGNVPGGVETAIMFSFFGQSVLNLTKPTGENLADNSAIRAMINRARNDKVDHFALMKEGRTACSKPQHLHSSRLREQHGSQALTSCLA